ncbi:MAG TPA: hypothetical protein VG650_05730 [Mycobacteriales bacterium]|nr:hypothetical protein [Mycobacteriales bacterium]
MAGFVPATASGSTPNTICVGLVIDSRSIGGSVRDGCVNVKPATTGVGVLEAAGHSLTFRRDGLLCTIDDVPSSGCSNVDDTHYWAYFHRAPDSTSWSYSNEGMSTYEPANRSTEGWVYDDGSSLQPKNIPASQICAGLVKPTVTPTPTPTKPHHTAVASQSPTTSTSPTGSGTSRPATAETGRPRHTPRASRGAGRPTAPATSPLPAASATAGSGADPGSSGASGHGSATGALVAAGVIAVLAGATVIGARRRRR